MWGCPTVRGGDVLVRAMNYHIALTQSSRRWPSASHWSRLLEGQAVCCAPHGVKPSAAPEPSEGSGNKRTNAMYIIWKRKTHKGQQPGTRENYTHTGAHVDLQHHVASDTHVHSRLRQHCQRANGTGACHTHIHVRKCKHAAICCTQAWR